MNDVEYRTHMSLWSMLAAPLLASNDMHTITPETLAILTNRDVIAIDQDELGKPGHGISKDGDREVWTRQLAGGDWAIALFNRGDQPAEMGVTPKDLGIARFAKMRDLWQHATVEPSPRFSAQVPAHGVVMLRVTPGK